MHDKQQYWDPYHENQAYGRHFYHSLAENVSFPAGANIFRIHITKIMLRLAYLYSTDKSVLV